MLPQSTASNVSENRVQFVTYCYHGVNNTSLQITMKLIQVDHLILIPCRGIPLKKKRNIYTNTETRYVIGDENFINVNVVDITLNQMVLVLHSARVTHLVKKI